MGNSANDYIPGPDHEGGTFLGYRVVVHRYAPGHPDFHFDLWPTLNESTWLSTVAAAKQSEAAYSAHVTATGHPWRDKYLALPAGQPEPHRTWQWLAMTRVKA